MNMHEIYQYRDEKDASMRNGYHTTSEDQRDHDRFTKDIFGGMHGIDPNSHGAELQ